MTWHQIPFLRLLLPLAAGIALEHYVAAVSLFGLGAWALMTLVFLLSLAWGWLRKQPKKSIRFWTLQTQVFFFSLGALAAYWQDGRRSERHISTLQAELVGVEAQYLATLAEPLQLRGTQARALLSLSAMRLHDSAEWQPIGGKILATLPADTQSVLLQYGDELLLRTRLRLVSGASNPKGLDLRTYYATRGIFHQAYIGAGQWQPTGEQQRHILKAGIYDLRDFLLSTIGEHCPTRRERAILSALVLGLRDEVDGELLTAFADVGAMHILSVSGMHVGLIAWLLSWILLRLPLPESLYWRGFRAILLVFLIWLFALVTGASPPALRSAAMFSIVSVLGLSKRQGNLYNSLAASAFFLLLYEPYWLWDLGFQLSYLALLGIAYYQGRIFRLWYIENRLLRYVWELTAVTIAATLSTLPLTLYYFHQFSLSAFWAGVLAVPLSTALLIMGFLLLIVGKIPLIGALLGWATYWLTWIFGALILWAGQLPYMVLRGIWIDTAFMWGLYLLIAFATWALYKGSVRWLMAGIGLALLLSLDWVWERYKGLEQRQICLYQVYKGSALSVIQGGQAATMGDSLGLSAVQLQRVQANHFSSLGIADTAQKPMNRGLVLERDFVFFSQSDQVATSSGLRIGCLSPAWRAGANAPPLSVNAVLITGGLRYREGAQALDRQFLSRVVVLDGTHSQRNTALWRAHCDSLGLVCIALAETGALVLDW